MLARKPEAVNEKLVTAKMFWTSFLEYKIGCFWFFQPSCNVYTITNISKWDHCPKCRYLAESPCFHSVSWQKSYCELWMNNNYRGTYSKEYPWFLFPQWSVSPLCLLPFLLDRLLRTDEFILLSCIIQRASW